MKEALRLEDTLEKICPECKAIIHEKMEEFKRCFEECVEERKKVEKAKWILIKKMGIDEEDAHMLLMASARRQRKKLVEIAEALIMGKKFLFKEVNENYMLEIMTKKKQKKKRNRTTMTTTSDRKP